MRFEKGSIPLSAVARRQLAQRLKEFKGLTREQRKDLLREIWQETAYTVGLRASSFARSCNAKEGGKLYQLIMAGAVATDKAFPPKEHMDLNEVVNLFGSLGQRGKQIVQPQTPLIEAKAQEVPQDPPQEEESTCTDVLPLPLSPVSSLPPAFGWPDAIKSNKSSATLTQLPDASIANSSRTSKSASKSSTKTKSKRSNHGEVGNPLR